jgi:hypothetical protein
MEKILNLLYKIIFWTRKRISGTSQLRTFCAPELTRRIKQLIARQLSGQNEKDSLSIENQLAILFWSVLQKT